MKRTIQTFLILLIAWFLQGCGDDYSCDTGEMRCSGNTVQMCNADHDWVDWLSCNEAGLTCYTDQARCGGHGDIACCD